MGILRFLKVSPTHTHTRISYTYTLPPEPLNTLNKHKRLDFETKNKNVKSIKRFRIPMRNDIQI